MSAVAESGMSESTVAESRGVRFFVLAGLIVAVHLAGLVVLLTTEYGPFAITLSVLAWAFVNCFLLAVLQRPGICAAMALALIGILIALSHFKFGILQLTLTFLDFLIIDRDTFSFLLSVFPRLQMQLIAAGLVAAPLLWVLWRFDPFRVRRRLALTGVAATAALIAVMAVASPEQAWEPFQGVNHISNLARSGVVAVSRLASTGWIEADPPANGPLRLAREANAAVLPSLPSEACDATAKRPHIIMLLDEFELRRHLGARHQGAGRIHRLFQVERRQAAHHDRGGDRRPDLVHRVQRADRPVGALVRRSEILRHADRRRPGHARAAAGPAALRLQDRLALSDLWRLPRRARLPEGHRRRRVHRHGRHGRERGHAARPVLLRSGDESVRARAGVAVAGLHVRLSHRQSFSLDRRLSARPDAGGLDAAGQHRRGRRVHPTPGHDGERVPRIHRRG